MNKRIIAVMLALSCALFVACGRKGGDTTSSLDRVNEVNQANSKVEEVDDKGGNKKIDAEHEFSYFVKTATINKLVEVYNYCEDLSDWGKYTKFSVFSYDYDSVSFLHKNSDRYPVEHAVITDIFFIIP